MSDDLKSCVAMEDAKSMLNIVENLQLKGAFSIVELKAILSSYDDIVKYVQGELFQADAMRTLMRAVALSCQRGKITLVESRDVIPVYFRVESILSTMSAASTPDETK